MIDDQMTFCFPDSPSITQRAGKSPEVSPGSGKEVRHWKKFLKENFETRIDVDTKENDQNENNQPHRFPVSPKTSSIAHALLSLGDLGGHPYPRVEQRRLPPVAPTHTFSPGLLAVSSQQGCAAVPALPLSLTTKPAQSVQPLQPLPLQSLQPLQHKMQLPPVSQSRVELPQFPLDPTILSEAAVQCIEGGVRAK